MSAARLQNWCREAVALHRAGRLEEAEKIYRQARAVAPKSFDLLHNSGLLAYQQGKLADALEWLGRAHQLNPKAVVCEMRLGLAFLAAGRREEAEKHLRRVVEIQPDYAVGWSNLAACLKSQDRLAEAMGCHEKAVTLDPKNASAWFNYGLTLSLAGRLAEALGAHERALAADPAYAMGHFGRGQALQQLHRPAEAVAAYERFLELKPGHHEAQSFRLFCLHYVETVGRERLWAEHLAYGRSLERTVPARWPNLPVAERRLKVAMLSPDLRAHSCAFFLEPLLENLSRDEFEVVLYHDHLREDAVSARLRQHASGWRNFVGQPSAAVEAAIRGDAPDIVIDLAGHTGMTARLPLFARRLAPVQITYLGYPDTTGVPEMDYRFTDALADPEGEADGFATERLVRFSECAWSYRPPENAPEPGRMARTSEGVVFGCFNNLAKVTDGQLAVWARVLAAVPTSRLLLKGKGLSEENVRARYRERCARAGISVERLDLVERTPDAKSHLGIYDGVDVALDTFPYHGTTTTCEALWMGVPVITLAGESHMARVGASLLRAAGRPEWVARTTDDYVELARSLGAAGTRGREERVALREAVRGSRLLNQAGHAADFGRALRDCWARWCNEQAGVGPRGG